jgi:hypothetical protein
MSVDEVQCQLKFSERASRQPFVAASCWSIRPDPWEPNNTRSCMPVVVRAVAGG